MLLLLQSCNQSFKNDMPSYAFNWVIYYRSSTVVVFFVFNWSCPFGLLNRSCHLGFQKELFSRSSSGVVPLVSYRESFSWFSTRVVFLVFNRSCFLLQQDLFSSSTEVVPLVFNSCFIRLQQDLSFWSSTLKFHSMKWSSIDIEMKQNSIICYSACRMSFW